MEIPDHITVYDIAVSDVSIINASVLNNDINITLGDYKTNAIKTVEVI